MRKIDNLMAWRAFLAVSRSGSLSQAAKLLDMDSPALSHLVSDLEKELGYELFDRSVRPFKLTHRGRIIADTCGPLTDSFREMIEQFDTDGRNIITVAAPTDLNQLYLHDQLLEYSNQHPEVQFYLRASCPIEDILSGRIDIALIDRPIPSPELVVRFCIEAISVPLASRGYIEKQGFPHTIDDLKNHTGLLLRQGMHRMTGFLFDEAGNMSPMLKWKQIFMTDAQLTLNHMMMDDMGIVIDCVPQHLIEQIKNDEVIPVLPGWRRKPQELCIVTRRDREAMSEPLHEFALWWRGYEKTAALARTKQAEAILAEALERHRND